MTPDAEKKKRKFEGNRVWDQSIGKDSKDRERLGKSRMFVALALVEKQANSKFFYIFNSGAFGTHLNDPFKKN